MNLQDTNEVRTLSQLELEGVAGGCFPVWVKGPYGIEGLSPTLDYNDPRLRDPGTWARPFGV